MKRIPTQGMLALDRKEKVKNRQWRERASGKKVRRGPGRPPRPKSKAAPLEDDGRVPHAPRPELRDKSALHVTLRAAKAVPNLRSRRRYAAIRNAFVKFAAPDALGFRLIHFAVLSNHVHFVVEADSKHALSRGMQKLLHSISRRLNALSVREHGARQRSDAAAKGYRALAGWIGRVFADRYHAHRLETEAEIQHAVRYVRDNAKRHYGASATGLVRLGGRLLDAFSSFVTSENDGSPHTATPRGYLLQRACAGASSQ